ncbi:hypothetical protein BCD67_25740 [Oscillatoriales cyanobacterium USR001]|nr:hypothetical protein BCD67_25740 [Oscillatoriales cyanobacterium USR001]
MSLKKLQVLIIATIVAASGVAAGGIVAYFYFKNLAEKAFSPQEIAKVIPQEAIMATFITPNPGALIQLQKFGTPEAQKMIGFGLNELRKQSFAGTDIDFNRDIQPWIGGIGVALLPPTEINKNEPPKLLMIVSIKDKIKAWNFANKLQGQQGAKTEESEYKGVKINHVTEKSGKRYSLALLGDRLAIAPYKQTLETAIDTFQGKTTLANQQAASAIFAKSTELPNQIATIFVADYSSFVQQLNANLLDNSKISSTALSQFKQVKSVVMAVGVDPQGVRLRVVSQLDASLAKQGKPQIGSKLLGRFPAETVAVIGGKGLNRIWSQVGNDAKDNPEVAKGILQLKQGFERLNLNADRDIFGWMDGEFALGAIASNQGILSQFGMGGTMIFETSNRVQAEATLKKLDAIASSNPSVSVASRKVKNTDVTEWQIPQQGTVFGHGWLNTNSVFIAFGGPLIDVITAPPQPIKNNTHSSVTIANFLPQPSQGYFYLDVEKTMSWANRYLLPVQPNLIPQPTIEILNSIQGIGISTTFPEPSTAQVDMLLGIKPKT